MGLPPPVIKSTEVQTNTKCIYRLLHGATL